MIKRMLEEKGLINEVMELEVEGLTHYMPVEVVVEFIADLPNPMQEQIKKKLTMIDFMNGDVLDFVKHLGMGIIQST